MGTPKLGTPKRKIIVSGRDMRSWFKKIFPLTQLAFAKKFGKAMAFQKLTSYVGS